MLSDLLFLERGAVRLDEDPGEDAGWVDVEWTAERDPAMWLPRADALAAEALEREAEDRRRWLRLAPRYMGRALRTRRYVRMSKAELERFSERVKGLTEAGATVVVAENVARD